MAEQNKGKYFNLLGSAFPSINLYPVSKGNGYTIINGIQF